MRILVALTALVMTLFALTAVAGKTVTDVAGTVKLVSEDGDRWALVPDGEPGTRYAPKKLPASMKKDGLRVKFSGKVGEIPPNVRMWGTPFELTRIEALEEKR